MHSGLLPEPRTLNPCSSPRLPSPKPRHAPPAARKILRLSRATVRALSRFRMAVLFPVHPFDFRVFPAAASVMAGGVIVALCARTFDRQFITPPVERPVLVTVVERAPELDNPRETTVAIPGDPPATADPTEVPPPPARQAADPELPALVLRLTRQVNPIAIPPMRIDPPAEPQPPALAAKGVDPGAFWQQVRRLIAAKAVYPPTAVRRNASGQVILRVRIGPRGELIAAGIATSSSDGALDHAALSAVREAAPFPVRGLELSSATNGIEALIPVRFELVDGPTATSAAREDARHDIDLGLNPGRDGVSPSAARSMRALPGDAGVAPRPPLSRAGCRPQAPRRQARRLPAPPWWPPRVCRPGPTGSGGRPA